MRRRKQRFCASTVVWYRWRRTMIFYRNLRNDLRRKDWRVARWSSSGESLTLAMKYRSAMTVINWLSFFDIGRGTNMSIAVIARASPGGIDLAPVEAWPMHRFFDIKNIPLPWRRRLFPEAARNTVAEGYHTSFLALDVPPFVVNGHYNVCVFAKTMMLLIELRCRMQSFFTGCRSRQRQAQCWIVQTLQLRCDKMRISSDLEGTPRL